MTAEVRELVHETIDLTGAQPPAMLDADAPVLRAGSQGSIYLVGLVGGKDVGKSTLVNALVGQQITTPTAFGPGTEQVVAYAHESARDQLQSLLEREVPGRFTIVTHAIERLQRQVLLDLPDIDSRYGEHIQITRRMLRHMLYPLWIQSIEKYADLRPQELLSAVSEGNDPANFLFCLNKVDQLRPEQAAELRDDYASRIARAVRLPSPPNVYLISAKQPEAFDLRDLRQQLARERPADAVQQSIHLAERQQDRSMLTWLRSQGLPDRSQHLARLEQDAEELVASRVVLPLMERAIPRMLDDPGQRMAMLAPAMRARLSRWPIVNALDALLSPVLSLVQKNLSASPSGSADPDAYLEAPVAANVQAAFAQLHQLHPQLGELCQQNKLWESMCADLAAAQLRQRFVTTLERQRQSVVERARGRFGALFAPIRWLLTLGAILWFPLVQPVLSVMLQENAWEFSKRTLRVIVDSLSVTHLLQCTTFLLLWMLILWILIRWMTQSRVSRAIERWKISDDDELSLPGQVLQWTQEMLEPIRFRRQRVESLSRRADELHQKLLAG